jgi:WD40 repeat protein
MATIISSTTVSGCYANLVELTPPNSDGESVIISNLNNFELNFYSSKFSKVSTINFGGPIPSIHLYPHFSLEDRATQCLLVSTEHRPIQLVDVASFSVVSSYTAASFTDEIVHPLSIKFSPTGQRIAGGFPQSVIRVWDVQSPGRQMHDCILSTRRGRGGQRGIIASLSWWDESVIVAGSYSKTIFMHDLNSGLNSLQIGAKSDFGGVNQIDTLPSSNRIVTGHRMDDSIRIWDIRAPDTPLSVIPRNCRNYQKINFKLINDKFIISGDSTGHVSLHTLEGGLVYREKFSESPIPAIGVNSDGMVAIGTGAREYDGIESDDECTVTPARGECCLSLFKLELPQT